MVRGRVRIDHEISACPRELGFPEKLSYRKRPDSAGSASPVAALRKGGLEPPRALTHQILNLVVKKAESLGNVRKNNTIAGFSANRKAESLGKIRNRSGRQMGDSSPFYLTPAVIQPPYWPDDDGGPQPVELNSAGVAAQSIRAGIGGTDQRVTHTTSLENDRCFWKILHQKSNTFTQNVNSIDTTSSLAYASTGTKASQGRFLCPPHASMGTSNTAVI